MKFLPDAAWFHAFRAWRGQRRERHDPAEMGTAFGLDSITVIDFESTSAPESVAGSPVASDWHRRVARRSRL
jgi:hypothetical protein